MVFNQVYPGHVARRRAGFWLRLVALVATISGAVLIARLIKGATE